MYALDSTINRRLRALVEAAMDDWLPVYRNDEDVNGADLVDYFGWFLTTAEQILAGADSPAKNSGRDPGE